MTQDKRTPSPTLYDEVKALTVSADGGAVGVRISAHMLERITDALRMGHALTMKVFPLRQRSPAARMEYILSMATEHTDPETGETIPPLITMEQARALLEATPSECTPVGEK